MWKCSYHSCLKERRSLAEALVVTNGFSVVLFNVFLVVTVEHYID